MRSGDIDQHVLSNTVYCVLPGVHQHVLYDVDEWGVVLALSIVDQCVLRDVDQCVHRDVDQCVLRDIE